MHGGIEGSQWSHFSCCHKIVTLALSWLQGTHRKLAYVCMYVCMYVCIFQLCTCSLWKFPSLGLNRNYSGRPTLQPQPSQIWAASATYTTAHSNTGSLTHWVRPWIEPASSWILVGFVTAEPQRKLLENSFKVPSYLALGLNVSLSCIATPSSLLCRRGLCTFNSSL